MNSLRNRFLKPPLPKENVSCLGRADDYYRTNSEKKIINHRLQFVIVVELFSTRGSHNDIKIKKIGLVNVRKNRSVQ